MTGCLMEEGHTACLRSRCEWKATPLPSPPLLFHRATCRVSLFASTLVLLGSQGRSVGGADTVSPADTTTSRGRRGQSTHEETLPQETEADLS